MIYAGIGSRNTPPSVIQDMRLFAYHAAKKGWVLRSGGAPGADSAFEQGCDNANGMKEIFIPFADFNYRKSTLYPPSPEAHNLAKTIHPVYNRLSIRSKALIARNMHQILGADLDTPVDCVVCWTSDGCESFLTYDRNTGGTGSAIALASLHGIPVFNINTNDRFIDAVEFLLNGG